MLKSFRKFQDGNIVISTWQRKISNEKSPWFHVYVKTKDGEGLKSFYSRKEAFQFFTKAREAALQGKSFKISPEASKALENYRAMKASKNRKTTGESSDSIIL